MLLPSWGTRVLLIPCTLHLIMWTTLTPRQQENEIFSSSRSGLGLLRVILLLLEVQHNLPPSREGSEPASLRELVSYFLCIATHIKLFTVPISLNSLTSFLAFTMNTQFSLAFFSCEGPPPTHFSWALSLHLSSPASPPKPLTQGCHLNSNPPSSLILAFSVCAALSRFSFSPSCWSSLPPVSHQL